MIRRDAPHGAEASDSWLLISQIDHARLSGEITEAWGGLSVEPLVCPADEAGHPLASVRRELIAAAYHHDDGWAGWSDAPLVDQATGRPFAFTEMPSAEAQRIWTDSIRACREHGLLAGWVVASHFSALQSKRDGDYPEWIDWLAEVDQQRGEWLTKWLADSSHHSPELAGRCLDWLQALDWISLWLCCRCPALPADGVVEPLVIGGDETGWPEITFEPQTGSSDTERIVSVAPWPFDESALRLTVPGVIVPVADYRIDTLSDAGVPRQLAWQLKPA